MSSPRPVRPILPAALTTAGLVVAAAVALPAAGAGAPPGADAVAASGSRYASSGTAGPTTSTTKAKPKKTTASGTTSPRPHCTGCVEHQVFGFEDGTAQRWLPYGSATATVTTAHAPVGTPGGTPPVASVPRTGSRQLTVTGMGNAAGLRWPTTTDAILSGFQVRVWVRPHDRAATFELRVSGRGGGAAATATAPPGEWTPIVTPRFATSDHSRPTVTLAQVDPCRDGDVGGFDLDDTAVASSFSPEPAVWRADDAAQLAPALTPITPSLVPCPSVTPTRTPSLGDATLIDFEDGTRQGWRAGAAGTRLQVTAAAALEGGYGLRLRSRPGTPVRGRLRVDPRAFGPGTWFVVHLRVAGAAGAVPTCGTATAGSATVTLSAKGAIQTFGGTSAVSRDAGGVTLWFIPGSRTEPVLLDLVSSASVSDLSVDDVVLTSGHRRLPPTTRPPTSSPPPTTPAVQPLCRAAG